MTDTKPKSTQDVTHQSLRLARRLDRLPCGAYKIEVVKGTKEEDWKLVLWDDTGQTLADTVLTKWE